MLKKIFIVLFVFTLLSPNLVLADEPSAQKVPSAVRLVNPIGGTEENPQGNFDMRVIMGNAIQITLRLLGSITLAVFFYGGYMWLTSAGNSEKVSKGTKTMLYAVIGLFIIFGAYAILNTIISGIRAGAANPNKSNSVGTKSNPSKVAEENNPCLDLRRDACIAKGNDCTYFIFRFPPNTKPSVSECIPKSERDEQCLTKHAECYEAIAQDLLDPKDCDNERDICMRL